MYQTIITQRDAGQRFDKYLRRLLPGAGGGFLYKMLRKKNITLNGKKADGSEKTTAGDCVAIYFSEETLQKFMQGGLAEVSSDARLTESKGVCDESATAAYLTAYEQLKGIELLYENDHLLLLNKPAGILSQKAAKQDLSLNEWLIGYLLKAGRIDAAELSMYKPSVCNRLDRNTSGIVLCAKSLRGAQLLGELLQKRMLHKYYQAYVKGFVSAPQFVEGYLYKDEKQNKVHVIPVHNQTDTKIRDGQTAYIKTAYKPLQTEDDKTLLEVELITGKPHQIRAHLASIGHPLLGDYKYGDKAWNEAYRKQYQITSQLLHAYKVVFPQLDEPFLDISGRTFYAELPEAFSKASYYFANC